jgi:hypothetical protein
MFDLERFLNFVRDRITQTDEVLPCEPEDCAAVMAYLVALVPEYQLACQADMSNGETRRADRRRAVLDGFRRARGQGPLPEPGDSEGDEDHGGSSSRGNSSSRRAASASEGV